MSEEDIEITPKGSKTIEVELSEKQKKELMEEGEKEVDVENETIKIKKATVK